MKASLITLTAALCLMASCGHDRNAPYDNSNGTPPGQPGPMSPPGQGSSIDTTRATRHPARAPHQKEISGEDQSVGSTGSATGAE